GSSGNLPFYYRVRTKKDSLLSPWENATPFPIYSACNNPALPVLSNAVGNSLNLSLGADDNSQTTTYSIYCVKDSMFLQSNGTLGASEIYQTLNTWGTLNVTGLMANTNYCFYAKAKNNNGDVRIAQSLPFSVFEPWSSNVLDTTAASPHNVWWSSDTSSSSPLQYYTTGGCSGGNVGFEGSNNNFWSSSLRSPAMNCTGLSQITFQFDLTNSFFSSHPNDKMTFSLWAPTLANPNGTFINALTVNGITGFTLPFDVARSCEMITVVYDLSLVSDKAEVLLYLNPVCGYNDANLFKVHMSNTSIGVGGISAACLETTQAVATGIEQSEDASLAIFPNPFKNNFAIQMNGDMKDATAQLYDETGRRLHQFNLPASQNFEVDAAGLSAGLYFLSITTADKKVLTKKLLKVD
ncbi:MAG: hypothetical protein JWO06_2651, partial [Bacteroidota bacterium]|nr:hypothetical protein [Bacteroidota bacterium]